VAVDATVVAAVVIAAATEVAAAVVVEDEAAIKNPEFAAIAWGGNRAAPSVDASQARM
jgi:hypothetical protein